MTFPPSGSDPRQRRRAAYGFVAGFIVLLLLAAAGWWSSLMAIPSFEWVSETQEGIAKAEGVMRLLAEAESAERAYVVTAESRYLREQETAAGQIDGLLDQLQAQVADKPRQLAILADVRALVGEKVAAMTAALQVREREGLDAARLVVAEDSSAAVSSQIRERLGEFISLEVVLRSRQEAVFLRRSRRATVAIGLALVVTIGLLAFAVRWLHRRMRDLENIVTVCAWTKRVKHRGEWISIEEYLRQRYGLQFSHGISEEAKKQLQLEALESAQRVEDA